MNYKLLPKEHPPRMVDDSRPPKRQRQWGAFSVVLKSMLLLLLAFVSQQSYAGFDFETAGYFGLDWQPTVEKPNMQIGLCFYDTNGSDSFFLHDATEGDIAGPAVYVDGKYICSPDWELAWPGPSFTGNDSALNDEKENDG